ncbi:hypothetical protein [Emticicia sp. TH156]|uniref:hypothetical protein n=1 Tax=Emticicia sp. TH156 TaxID=2067454 RepID=UPI000C76DCC2|nr:hypothetical protein [Emticicia sp. TH156]PLK43240.1 hypothetical protein C0V77_17880 [Emticicia sp. TH156]
MKLRISLIILALLVIGIAYYLTVGHYSKGDRAGTISKISERGYIFKTFEGVLNEGGYSGETGTLTPRYWDFSCKLDSVTTKLEKALKTGERVTLKYQEKFFQFPWNGDTKYFVVDVEFLNDREVPTKEPFPHPQQESAPADSAKSDNLL